MIAVIEEAYFQFFRFFRFFSLQLIIISWNIWKYCLHELILLSEKKFM